MDRLLSAIHAVQNGDRKAFADILACIKKPQLNYIANLVKNMKQAEDIFQELCLRIFNNIHRCPIEDRKHLDNWIYKISTNLCNDHFRKEKRKPVTCTFDDTQFKESGNIDNRDEIRIIENALQALPIKKRQAFTLVTINEVSIKDTAEIIGVPQGTVKTCVHRVKKHLRNCLNR